MPVKTGNVQDNSGTMILGTGVSMVGSGCMGSGGLVSIDDESS